VGGLQQQPEVQQPVPRVPPTQKFRLRGPRPYLPLQVVRRQGGGLHSRGLLPRQQGQLPHSL
jgi:hypothetical protein